MLKIFQNVTFTSLSCLNYENVKKDTIMKNIIITLILAASFTTSAIAMNPSYNYLPLMSEAYVNDIPFNTTLIAAFNTPGSTLNNALEVNGESYINDIPFDTRAIAEKENRNLSFIPVLTPEDEPYANDLPFKTAELADEL
jgi:hypothetical protein